MQESREHQYLDLSRARCTQPYTLYINGKYLAVKVYLLVSLAVGL